MRFSFFIALLFLSQSLFPLKARVGEWATVFSTQNPILAVVESQERIWAVTKMGLFYVDTTDHLTSDFTKVEGLSGIGLSCASYHSSSDKFIIGYDDGRIDILKDDNVYTIYDIQRKNITGDKNVNHIYFFKQHAYLSMGFGIVVLDVSKNEIVDTYFIGENNTSVNIQGLTVMDQIIYAASDRGVYQADVSARNLNDYRAWSLVPDLPRSNYTSITSAHDKIVLVALGDKDSLLVGESGSWSLLNTSNFDKLTFFDASAHGFIRVVSSNSQQWRVELLDTDFEIIYSFTMPWGDPARVTPQAAVVTKNGDLWIGQGLGMLYKVTPSTGAYSVYERSGPSFDNAYSLHCGASMFFMTEGGVNPNYSSMWNRFNVAVFSSENWVNFNNDGYPLGKFTDAMYAVEDPYSPGIFYVGSSARGLLEFNERKFVKAYNRSNSILSGPLIQDSLYCRVLGMDFDSKGDLWMCNSLADKALVQKKRDGTWRSYSIASFFDSDISRVLVDYYDQKWLLGRGGKLFVCREKNGLMECLNININYGNNLSASSVYSVMEDEDGYIWIGTDRGPRVIYHSAKIFDNPIGNYSSVESKVIYVVDGDRVPELLRNEAIVCIEMDGANQKWIGTQSNGVYLVSPDGTEEIHHFTKDNSPLISNTIMDIAVDKKNGYAFFATSSGVLSYRGVATLAPEKEKIKEEDLLVFPNPVRPDYVGLISIKGLPNNADVKITDTKGNLIYRAKAQGGQAVWDGKNFKGERPKSGVFLIFSTNEDGSVTKSGKLFFVR